MKSVNLDEIIIGEGRPKICVPIVAANVEEAIAQASELVNIPVDLIEVRGDYLDHYFDFTYISKLLHEVKRIADRPIIYTFRTGREGGEKNIEVNEYSSLLTSVIKSGEAELLDVELFMGDETVAQLIKEAHEAGVKVILSNHDFDKTPPKAEIVLRLLKMQELGADIAKIAVMPQNKYDVNVLLAATTETYEQADIPIVTMSMGRQGAVSRITGEVFGSAITFGVAGKASAPGQLNVDELANALDIIHRQCV